MYLRKRVVSGALGVALLAGLVPAVPVAALARDVYAAAAQAETPFADVTADTPHASDIAWLYEAGISRGWAMPDGTAEFRPFAKIGRADMAAFLFRLAVRWGVARDDWQPAGGSPFSDVDASTPHYREVLWLADAGISAGWAMPDGTAEFRPSASVTRADMAAFLHRLYGKVFSEDGGEIEFQADAAGFVDVTSSTPHADDIAWLADEGISRGWAMGDGTVEYRPYAYIARADMAAFLHRLDGLV